MIAYSPLHPRHLLEAIVLLISAYLFAFHQMFYFGFSVAAINYWYWMRRTRHIRGYQQASKSKPAKNPLGILSDEENKMQQLLTERGFPAKVTGSINAHRRIIFDVQLPRSFSVKKLTADLADIQRAYGVNKILIEPSVSGKPGISRISIPKKVAPPALKLSALFETDEFKTASRLAIPIGQNAEGKPELRPLNKMPHVLVGGTTGCGKSVEVNAWIISLIVKNDPSELQLILIDPKMLEFNIYEKARHLAIPVVLKMEEAAATIKRVNNEMEYRYEIMSHFKVRNIDALNKKIRGRKAKNPLYSKADTFVDDKAIISHCEEHLSPMPTLAMVVDEMADLVLRFKEVENLIATLAGKARASGIHLILCTQNPLVSVVTSLIKANITTRFALQTASIDDSQTLLGKTNTQAASLLGDGDGYLHDGNNSVYVQGYFIDADEIEAIIEQQNKQATGL